MALRLRELTEAERLQIDKLAHSRTAPARQVERAKIVFLAHQGQRAPTIAQALGLDGRTVRSWMTRFNQLGLAGLEDQPRGGGPGDRRCSDGPAKTGPAV